MKWKRPTDMYGTFRKVSWELTLENDYEPKYITIRGKGDILANLRKEGEKSG